MAQTPDAPGGEEKKRDEEGGEKEDDSSDNPPKRGIKFTPLDIGAISVVAILSVFSIIAIVVTSLAFSKQKKKNNPQSLNIGSETFTCGNLVSSGKAVVGKAVLAKNSDISKLVVSAKPFLMVTNTAQIPVFYNVYLTFPTTVKSVENVWTWVPPNTSQPASGSYYTGPPGFYLVEVSGNYQTSIINNANVTIVAYFWQSDGQLSRQYWYPQYQGMGAPYYLSFMFLVYFTDTSNIQISANCTMQTSITNVTLKLYQISTDLKTPNLRAPVSLMNMLWTPQRGQGSAGVPSLSLEKAERGKDMAKIEVVA